MVKPAAPLITHPNKSPLPVILLSVIATFSLATAGLLYWQNRQLQTQLAALTTAPPVQPSPIPTIFPDSTAGWKTFTDNTLHYTFNFPDTWVQSKTESTWRHNTILNTEVHAKTDRGVDGQVIAVNYSLIIRPLVTTNNLDKWLNDSFQTTGLRPINREINSLNVATLDNAPSADGSLDYFIRVPNTNTYVSFYLTPYNAEVPLSGQKEMKQIMDQILSTFKFLEPAGKAVTGTPGASPSCKVGGCSGELCLDAAGPDIASTCLYKAEYACYKTATCAKQSDGRCGWTPTSALTSCLNAGGLVESSLSE